MLTWTCWNLSPQSLCFIVLETIEPFMKITLFTNGKFYVYFTSRHSTLCGDDDGDDKADAVNDADVLKICIFDKWPKFPEKPIWNTKITSMIVSRLHCRCMLFIFPFVISYIVLFIIFTMFGFYTMHVYKKMMQQKKKKKNNKTTDN